MKKDTIKNLAWKSFPEAWVTFSVNWSNVGLSNDFQITVNP